MISVFEIPNTRRQPTQREKKIGGEAKASPLVLIFPWNYVHKPECQWRSGTAAAGGRQRVATAGNIANDDEDAAGNGLALTLLLLFLLLCLCPFVEGPEH